LLGVIAAGVIIITTGWQYADLVFSVLLGVLVRASAWAVLRDSLLQDTLDPSTAAERTSFPISGRSRSNLAKSGSRSRFVSGR
jgi:Co/Zn/Cd efflux system component